MRNSHWEDRLEKLVSLPPSRCTQRTSTRSVRLAHAPGTAPRAACASQLLLRGPSAGGGARAGDAAFQQCQVLPSPGVIMGLPGPSWDPASTPKEAEYISGPTEREGTGSLHALLKLGSPAAPSL